MIAIRSSTLALLTGLALLSAASASAQNQDSGAAATQPSWADLADLADASKLVVRVRIKKQAELEPERATGVAPGKTRLYLEAETVALIAGTVPVGESLRYLVDVPLDARGRAPKLKKTEQIIFARPVPGRVGEVQLVARDAQLAWQPDLELRLRPILTALVAPDSAPRITGIRDALSVRGNLTGESETQVFLETASGAPLAMSVIRRPGMAPVWGVSYSEIVDQAVRAPRYETLPWYRLACFLPDALPGAANLSRDPADRAQVAEDYRFVKGQLGPCPRTRIPPEG